MGRVYVIPDLHAQGSASLVYARGPPPVVAIVMLVLRSHQRRMFVDLRKALIEAIKATAEIAQEIKDVYDQLQA